jgi:hypothetical protein
MLFEEYYSQQLKFQRDINNSIIDKFKEIEITINDNNKDIYNEINKIKNNLSHQEPKQEQQETLFSYNPINYIAAHLFYGFLVYEGFYFISKIFIMNGM